MNPVTKEDILPCRHNLDHLQLERLKNLLATLHERYPEILIENGIEPPLFDVLFRASIESIRGTFSAKQSEKRRFLESILYWMQSKGELVEWAYIGGEGRQDYRIQMDDDYLVCLEDKGCPDGNNMTIWERPEWADEFIVWSQCPGSLAHDPALGVWSGIATRLFPKMLNDGQLVDAFIFYDEKCGSNYRICPKKYGVEGNLRISCTDVPGQDDRVWLPPPCVYLFPSELPNVKNPSTPEIHSLTTCRFSKGLIRSLGVPDDELDQYCGWARVETDIKRESLFKRVSVGTNLLDHEPIHTGSWSKFNRMTYE